MGRNRPEAPNQTATVPKNSHAHKGESSHAQVKVSSTINQAAPAAGGMACL
jgi:hypothetical protein